MTLVKCNVCTQKKAQRNCPALQQLICPTCCGEHKEKVQDCPKDCIYLIESELFKDEKFHEEMIIKTDRVKRDIVNGEEKYTELIEGVEDVVYKKVSRDENFEDDHVLGAINSIIENYMSRTMKTIEEEEDIKLNRVGTLRTEIQDYLKTLSADEEAEFENYEIAACFDMVKIMIETQKTTSEEEDKRTFINSLIETKKEKETKEESEKEEEEASKDPGKTSKSSSKTDKTEEKE